MKLISHFILVIILISPTQKLFSQFGESKEMDKFNGYLENKQYEKALNFANNLIKADSTDYLGYYNRGVVYSKRGANDRSEEDYKIAAKDFQQSIKLNPNFTASYINLGDAYSHYDYLDKAEAEYRKALKLDSTLAMGYNNIGYIKSLYGYHYSAIDYYNKCLHYDNKHKRAYINKSISLVELGNIKEALK
ncbi:MAG: tetratricopeptide repeat protein, partial [Vicingaceae bacterium]